MVDAMGRLAGSPWSWVRHGTISTRTWVRGSCTDRAKVCDGVWRHLHRWPLRHYKTFFVALGQSWWSIWWWRWCLLSSLQQFSPHHQLEIRKSSSLDRLRESVVQPRLRSHWALRAMKFHLVLAVAALYFCAFLHHCDAFLHVHTLPTSPVPSKLNLRSSSDDNSQHNAYLHNTKRTCFHHFLTQRSIQSFMFLLTQVRDPHTSDWIERFLESTNLLEYHGTGAFNLTRFPEWDTFFWEMLDEPKTSVIVEARRRAPIFGGSRNNPYLKKEVRRKWERVPYQY